MKFITSSSRPSVVVACVFVFTKERALAAGSRCGPSVSGPAPAPRSQPSLACLASICTKISSFQL